MKKIFIVLCILGICRISIAQPYLPLTAGSGSPLTGNVIVKADDRGFVAEKADGTVVAVLSDVDGNNIDEGRMDLRKAGVEKVVLRANGNSYFNGGNIGIGTTSPNVKMHIVGDANTYTSRFVGSGTTGQSYGAYIQAGTNSSDYAFAVANVSDAVNYLSVRGDGNVGIGTTSPTEKLSVNGRIQAKEIKVETGWSDFVFEPTYKLPDLKETERFIKANKHLPEIPSAKEVAESGINLGEMNAKLLQKIEELTLYLIEQNKTNNEQGIRMKDQEEKMQEFGKKIVEQQKEIDQLKSKP